MEENSTHAKKMKLLAIIIILLILFIGYGVSVRPTPKTREKRIISYLEKKYNSQFEIIKLKGSGEDILYSKIDFDGATIWPEIKNKGVYYYNYEVKSVSDSVTLTVVYLDRKIFPDKIKEVVTYYAIKNKDKIMNDMADYILDTIGREKTEVTLDEDGLNNNSSLIVIEVDKALNEIYNADYVNKLKQIAQYAYEKNNLDEDVNIDIRIIYKNNIWIDILLR